MGSNNDVNNAVYLPLDLTDATQAALAGYAAKIAKVLNLPEVQANADVAGTLDDFLGAVYALILARHHGFTDRTVPIQIKSVRDRANKIAKGQVRTNGKWVGGFYFNNALFRIAAIYHRALHIVTKKKDGYVPELLPDAERLYAPWKSDKLGVIHTQVNKLKDKPKGVHQQRTATYADAVAAAGELISLIEAWTSKNVPPKKKP